MKIVDAGSGVIVKANDDVPFAHSGIPRRAVSLERHDLDSAISGILKHALDNRSVSGDTDRPFTEVKKGELLNEYPTARIEAPGDRYRNG